MGDSPVQHVYYKMDGSEPNRILTIEFVNYHRYDPYPPPHYIDMEVSFYELDGKIVLQYRNIDEEALSEENLVGINAGDGDYGSLWGSFTSDYEELDIEYTRQAHPAHDIRLVSVDSLSPDDWIVEGDPVAIGATIKNLGDSPESNFWVRVTLSGPNGFSYTDSVQTAYLEQEEISSINFPSTPAPYFSGAYSALVEVLLPTDGDPSNDSSYVPFHVVEPAPTAEWNYQLTVDPAGTTYVWIDATVGTEIPGAEGDNASEAVPWPFDFPIYDHLHQEGEPFFVSSNGWIRFDAPIDDDYYPLLFPSSSDLVGQCLALCADDLDTDDGDTSGVFYIVTGSPGEQVLTVEYQQVHTKWHTGAYLDMQVSFYEGDGVIVIKYGHIDYSSLDDDNLVGINAGDGIYATELPPLLDSYDYYQLIFTPGDVPEYDVGVMDILSPSYGLHVSRNEPVEVSAIIGNLASVSSDTTVLVLSVIGPGSYFYSEAIQTEPLAPDSQRVITFSPWPGSSISGSYIFEVNLIIADDRPENDTLSVPLFVDLPPPAASWDYQAETDLSGDSLDWVDATPGTLLVDASEEWGVGTIKWPFDFVIYDNQYYAGENLYVSANGWIRFDNGIDPFSYPEQGDVPSSLLGQWIAFGTQPNAFSNAESSGVYLIVTNSAPNRVLTVEFVNCYQADGDSNSTFDIEVNFYENDSTIGIQLGNVAPGAFAPDNLVGINAGEGSFGTCWGSFSEAYAQTDLIFRPSSPYAKDAAPVLLGWNSHPPVLAEDVNFEVYLVNCGSQFQGTVPVDVTVPSTGYAGQGSATSVAPGETASVSITPAFRPELVEDCEVVVITALSGEEHPTNDTLHSTLYVWPTGTWIGENFDGDWGPLGDVPPRDWSIIDLGSEDPSVWNYNDWHSYDAERSGNVARVIPYPPESQDERLISSSASVQDTAQVLLTFWHDFDPGGASTDTGYIDISTNGGATWPISVATIVEDTVVADTVDVTSSVAEEDDVVLRFRLKGIGNARWSVDDVRLWSVYRYALYGTVQLAGGTGDPYDIPVVIEGEGYLDTVYTWHSGFYFDLGLLSGNYHITVSPSEYLPEDTIIAIYDHRELNFDLWPGQSFIRGDANADSTISMSDAIYTLKYLYVPGTDPPLCLKTADADDEGTIAMSDAIYLLKYLYVPGAPEPPGPFPDCGSDETPDELGCESHPCMGGKSLQMKGVDRFGGRLTLGKPEIDGRDVVVPVYLDNEVELAGFAYTIQYDPSALRGKSARNDDLVSREFDFSSAKPESEKGKIRVGNVISLDMRKGLPPGQHHVADVLFEFVPDDVYRTELRLVDVELVDTDANALSCETEGITIDRWFHLRVPEVFALNQAFPNPFTGWTTINYQLPKESHVVLKVFNINGQVVNTLVDEKRKAGYHRIRWDGKDAAGMKLASGVYFYKIETHTSIETGEYRSTKKMILLQ